MVLFKNQMTIYLLCDLYPFLLDFKGNRLHCKQISVQKDKNRNSEQNKTKIRDPMRFCDTVFGQ